MPSQSVIQKQFMAIACHDPEFAKKHGIDQKTACEYYEADKAIQQQKTKPKSK